MQIEYLKINRFKSIDSLEIQDIEDALILVGQNSTGKTTVLDAIRAVGGTYQIRPEDFDEDGANIEITVSLKITEEDLQKLQHAGKISSYRKFNSWKMEFCKKLPSFDGERLSFVYIVNRDGKSRYEDGYRKNNPYVREVFPIIYDIGADRNLTQFQNAILSLQEDAELKRMRENTCLFNDAKQCKHCFSCIGLLNQKTPEELSAFETSKLLDYKLYQLNLDEFAKKVNENFKKNGGQDEILYSMNRNVESMLSVTTEIYQKAEEWARPIERLGKGMRSIYMLSLLETYAEEENQDNSIIVMEEPEIFLHPTMQKVSGDILYRLSKNRQVIFFHPFTKSASEF